MFGRGCAVARRRDCYSGENGMCGHVQDTHIPARDMWLEMSYIDGQILPESIHPETWKEKGLPLPCSVLPLHPQITEANTL